LGYDVPTFVRTAEKVAAAAAHTPFPDASEEGTLHIAFLRDELDPVTRNEVAELAKDTDRVAFSDRELYWLVAGRFIDSALSGRTVGKVFRDAWTVWTAETVRRIAATLPR
ncbi:MAG: DUF1697 domain-containing protein, partial [Actinomycetota bacterium]|nr:DUF1697 domain-containing protein [Actinomycetota bacterium]